MVISGLYSDKPKSITREIYSNAFDAHAMVGKEDVPFDVVYPTSLTPTFTVRDYGPGIRHEDMEGFYTVLGHSTKEDTNTAVGKWGVGRMSPMSYTDSFTVISRHKGMKAYYSVQLGPDGEPALHTLSEPTPCDEPDGLEVSFPIDRRDVRSFADAARHMAMGLKVKPHVLNDENPFAEVKKTVEGEGFYFFEYFSSQKVGPFAQMGCVLYPISQNYVPSRFWHANLVLEFDIGELDVTASREELSYDEETVKNIEARFDKLDAQLRSIAEDKVKTAKTEFEARKFYGKITKSTRLRSFSVDWNGINIDYDLYNLPISCVTSSVVETVGKTKAYWVTQHPHTIHPDRLQRVYLQNIAKKTRDVRANDRIWNNEHGKGSDARAAIWLRYDSTDPNHVAEIDTLKQEFSGHVEFIYVKDIPDPGPQGQRSKTRVKEVKGSVWRDIDLSDKEFQDGGYYIPISNNMADDEHKHWESLHQYMKAIKGFDRCIVVPKTYWSKFQNAPQWKTLRSLAQEYVEQDTKKKVEYALSDWKHNRHAQILVNLPVGNAIFAGLRRKVYEDVKTYDWLSQSDMKNLLVITGKLDWGEQSYPDKYVAMIYSKYPLLTYYRNSMEQEFADYVQMIDAQEEETLAA
jgi:hypothetical protein